MTLVLLHYQHELERLICLSDTRIRSGDRLTTDLTTKSLPLSVRVHEVGSSYEIDSDNVKSIDFGFAFAGSALGAFSTYSWATAVLNNLVPSDDLPQNWQANVSIHTVVKAVEQSAKRVFFRSCEIASGSIPPNSDELLNRFGFKILLFGFDSFDKKFCVFRLTTNFGENDEPAIDVVCAELDEHHNGATFYIGDNSFEEKHARLASTGDIPNIERLFGLVFDDANVSTVGGHFTAGISTKTRFLMLPITNGNARDDVQKDFTILGETYNFSMLDGLIVARQAIPINWKEIEQSST